VTARVKSGHQYVEKFQQLMAQPNIVADLKYAAENPKTDESRKLMNKVMPVIKLAGQKTDWGPIARAVCVSKITAMVRLSHLFILNHNQIESTKYRTTNIRMTSHSSPIRRKHMAPRTISAHLGMRTVSNASNLTISNNISSFNVTKQEDNLFKLLKNSTLHLLVYQ
jgi:hypothetical protein